MFGMSSKEFWEDDPQLYWAYRIFYLKQREVEQEDLKYNSWLLGSINMVSTSLALNNAFSKQKHNYPTYEEMFENKKANNKQEKLTRKDIDKKVQEENLIWARY